MQQNDETKNKTRHRNGETAWNQPEFNGSIRQPLSEIPICWQRVQEPLTETPHIWREDKASRRLQPRNKFGKSIVNSNLLKGWDLNYIKGKFSKLTSFFKKCIIALIYFNPLRPIVKWADIEMILFLIHTMDSIY